MITINKPYYKCEHCKKVYLREKACLVHENGCWHNPDNKRPCFDCKHLCKKQTSYYRDMFDGSESEEILDLFHCNKKEVFLYTPNNEAKGNWFDLGDERNDPMPKTCEDFLKPKEDLTFKELFNLEN